MSAPVTSALVTSAPGGSEPVWVEPVAPGPVGPVDSEPVVRRGIGPEDLDTDADGVPDTVAVVEGPDLVLHTDLDGDGLADRTLRLGPATLAPREVHWWAPWTWFGDD
ncbi:hypothetical protein [Pseudonocardia xishanensis]|uniref:hypothetical protein n=1 Tax=Pseudonocardia xishanensis TaxID=630995 RepID=UPI0031E60097